MKKIVLSLSLLLALCLGVVLNSCEKDKDKNNKGNLTENPFLGVWQETEYLPDYRQFSFYENKTFQFADREKGETSVSLGTYSYTANSDILTIVFNDGDRFDLQYQFLSSTDLLLKGKKFFDDDEGVIFRKK